MKGLMIMHKSGTLSHPLAIAVQLDYKYGSKLLIDKIPEVGMAESCNELHHYKYCYLKSSHEADCKDDKEFGNKDVVTNVGESERTLGEGELTIVQSVLMKLVKKNYLQTHSK